MAKQRKLLDLTGYNLKRAYMRFYQDLAETLVPLDLRQRNFSVLSLVIENPAINQSDVARSLGIERSGTVVIVDDLEGRGLIKREATPGDRRSYGLRASLEGQQLYETAMARILEHEDRILSGLSQVDRQALDRLLHQIHQLNPEGS